MIFKYLNRIRGHRAASSRVAGAILFCAAVTLAASLGCTSLEKKTEPKELAKMSLDAQEEAQKLRDDGNLQASAAKYQEALRYHPSPSVHYELGEVLEKLGKYNEAGSQYGLAIAKNPDMPEAKEALTRLEARQQLAKTSLTGDIITPGMAREKVASASGTAASPSVAAKSQPLDVDVFDEERKFREMSDLKPPTVEAPQRPASPDLLDSPYGGDEETADVEENPSDSLVSDAEALYGSGRGSEQEEPTSPTFNESSSEDKELSPAEPSAPAPPPALKPKPPRAAGTTPKKPKNLKGGRGLVSADPPEINITFANGIAMTEDQSGSLVEVLRIEQALAPDTPEMILAAGRPGERGLGGTKKYPGDAPLPLSKTTQPTKASKPPRISADKSSQNAAAAAPNAAKTTAPATAPTVEEEEKGFFSGIFGEDKITYPEPPTPEVEKSLAAPYKNEREELDIRPFHTSRLKGRRKVEADLEICKDRYYKEKDLEGAVRCFNDKKIDFPDNPLVYYELSLVLEDAGDYTMARENLELACRYAPGNQEYRAALARLDVGRARQLRTNGDYPGALSLLKRTIEKYPEMVEAHRELGRVYSADALAKEQGLQEGTPASPDLEQIIRKTWFYAEQAYDQVTALSEGDYKDWYNLGVAIQKQGLDQKRSAAIKAYETSVSMNPEYANAYYHLGILYETANVPKAAEHYETALSIARRTNTPEGKNLVVKCLGSLGELYWRTGNKEKAANYLTEYLQYAPNDAYIEQMMNQISTEPPGDQP